MTRRALFPGDVRARSSTLNYDVDSTAEELRQLGQDTLPGGGRISGLAITCSGATTAITSVSAGTARAPNGESIVIDQAVANLALADSAVGAVNYVCAVYREASGTPLPTTTGQTARNTQVTQTSDVVVLSAEQFDALPATADDFEVNALDRLVNLGIVLGAGASVVIPAANVSQGSISSEVRGFSTNLSSTSIPGITITAITDNAPTGTLTLEYTPTTGLARVSFSTGGYGAVSGDLRLLRTASLAGAGAAVTRYVDLEIIPELLPTTGAALTTTVTVIAPYATTSSGIASAIDQTLRGTQGATARTWNNLLGIGLGNLASVTANSLPGLLAVGASLLDTAAGADLARFFAPTSSTQANTCVFAFPVITGVATGRVFVRLYKLGSSAVLTLNARYPNGGTTWYSDSASYGALRLQMSVNGEVTLAQAAGTSWADSTGWSTRSIWGDTESILNLGYGFLAAVSAILPRISMPASATGEYRTCMFSSTESGTSRTVNIYRVGGANTFELAFNAAYTNGAANPWSLVDSTARAMRIALTNFSLGVSGSIVVQTQAALASAWSAWPTTALTYDIALGTWSLTGNTTFQNNLNVNGDLYVAGDVDYGGLLNGGAGVETVIWSPSPACMLRTETDPYALNATENSTVPYNADNYFTASGSVDPVTLPTAGLQLLAAATGDIADCIIPFPALPDEITITEFRIDGSFTSSGSGGIELGVARQNTAGNIVWLTTGGSGLSGNGVNVPTASTISLVPNQNAVQSLTSNQGPFFAYIRKDDPSGWGMTRFVVRFTRN